MCSAEGIAAAVMTEVQRTGGGLSHAEETVRNQILDRARFTLGLDPAVTANVKLILSYADATLCPP